jgi:threonine aldolase
VRCTDWYASSVPAGTQLQADEVVVRFVSSWSSTDEEIAALMDLVHSHQRQAA